MKAFNGLLQKNVAPLIKTGMKSTSLEKSALKMFNLVELTQNIQVKHVTIKEDG